MRARQAIVVKPYETSVREVELPPPAPNQVLVATEASAVSAGTMLSRRGNAMVAPSPRSAARRDICILVTNIGVIPCLREAARLLPHGRPSWLRRIGFRDLPHLERLARDNAEDER